MGVRAYVIRLSQISFFFSYCHDKYATLTDVVKHCVENLTNHVLRYGKLLMDDKSGMMKYQTGLQWHNIVYIKRTWKKCTCSG